MSQRPTWIPAKGGEEQGGTRKSGSSQKTSSRDLASQMTLKSRKEGQHNQDHCSSKAEATKIGRICTAVPREIDADDSDEKSYSESDNNDSDDDDGLLAEVARIKKEKYEERLGKERLGKQEQIIRGNPLVSNAASFTVKRSWDDDVAFKRQSCGEAKTPKRFINDTIRNDFHRKLLQKYMK
ncbi:hypothetical protein MKW98_019994 [Papaver atlanticum]|uniref:Pre-mRNA-splicing factor CWC15 n=1 Tax=Papaver atlanticum TaxID=357466 RepID=A0AAD4S250_9MAGN|nr:hypothetical protein MKW98_019994 [Papaver atlanticum]